MIIITALSSDQVIRTADIVGALGAVLVNGKPAQMGIRKLAAECGIGLVSTRKSMLEACLALGSLLGAGS